jgi:hypothetical protein
MMMHRIGLTSSTPRTTRILASRSRAHTTRVAASSQRCQKASDKSINDNVVDGAIDGAIDGKAVGIASLAVLYPLVASDPALAIGREYGLLEGQIMSLMHPALMFFLLGSSLYAGYLGFQWRRARELAGEIKELKAQLPKAVEGEPTPSSPLDATIKGLEEERKGLIQQKLNEKHHNWGSLILGLGTLMAIAGPCNTFLRTGKLFPGPHLYAGAGMVVLWAAAAALVPSMQKGNDTSRSLHIAFNAVNVGLFLWQVPTGLDIVAKVFQFTTLP